MTHTPETATRAALQHLRAAAESLLSTEPAGPEEVQLRVHIGRGLLAAGDAGLARALADAVLPASASAEPVHLAVDAALREGDVPSALAALEAGRDRFPRPLAFLRKKLDLLRRAGRHSELPPVAAQLLAVVPDDPLLLVQIGRAALVAGDPDLAGTAFGRALDADTHDAGAWIGRIDVALRRQDSAEACALAEAAVRVLPRDPGVLQKAGRALTGAGRADRAREILEAAIADDPAPPAGPVLALAAALRSHGAHDRADAMLAALAERVPENAQLWRERIDAALASGDIDRALDLGRDGLVHCPDSVEVVLPWSNALNRAGRDAEALPTLEALRRRWPAQIRVALALARAYRGLCRNGDADAVYCRVLEQAPENWPALQGRVAIAEAGGDLTAAMRLLEAAVSGDTCDVRSTA